MGKVALRVDYHLRGIPLCVEGDVNIFNIFTSALVCDDRVLFIEDQCWSDVRCNFVEESVACGRAMHQALDKKDHRDNAYDETDEDATVLNLSPQPRSECLELFKLHSFRLGSQRRRSPAACSRVRAAVSGMVQWIVRSYSGSGEHPFGHARLLCSM